MGVVVRPADRPGDLGWMVWQHGEVYAEQFGWDTSFEALVAGSSADYAQAPCRPRRAGWIAELDGRRIGCVLCVPAPEPHAWPSSGSCWSPRTPAATAPARPWSTTCVAFARAAGYDGMTLWTNANLVSARRIYEAAGFELVDEEPDHRFGADLVGQHWRLERRPSRPSRSYARHVSSSGTRCRKARSRARFERLSDRPGHPSSWWWPGRAGLPIHRRWSPAWSPTSTLSSTRT